MFVLTRKVGESIVIGDSIRVMVTAVVKGMAKIGIDAPDDVLVDRQEVRNRRDEFADVPCVLPNRCACEKSP
jgi:carbon storage regulator